MWPEPLISDGVVQKKALDAIGKSEVWLHEQLIKNKVVNSNEVFLCLWKKDGLWLIMK